MTRFHISALIAGLLAAAAWGLEWWGVLGGVAAGFVVLVGCGVALPQMRFFGPFVCAGEGTRREVALTFDDGPDARSTPALLEVLREAGVEAAFFGIGRRVEENAELAARIVREGHLLQNHSFAHSYAMNFFSVGRVREDVARAQGAIERATGAAPKYFRPPVGLSNPRVFRAARELNLTMLGWTAGGLDTRLRDPARIVARVERRLRPGAIILLHDGNIPADRLAAAVKLLLDRLRALGYEVVRLDRLLSPRG